MVRSFHDENELTVCKEHHNLPNHPLLGMKRHNGIVQRHAEDPNDDQQDRHGDGQGNRQLLVSGEPEDVMLQHIEKIGRQQGKQRVKGKGGDKIQPQAGKIGPRQSAAGAGDAGQSPQKTPKGEGIE